MARKITTSEIILLGNITHVKYICCKRGHKVLEEDIENDLYTEFIQIL